MTASADDMFSKIGKFFVTFVFASVFIPLFFIPIAFLDGWAVSKLWRWFVVPLFHAPELHVAQTVGLILLLRHITVGRTPKDDRKLPELVAQAIAAPLFVLLVGWIIKTWFLPDMAMTTMWRWD